MKKIISLLLVIALVMRLAALAQPASDSLVTEDLEAEEMKGVWVATVANIDYPSKQGLSTKKLKKELEEIVLNTSKCGLNTIFFQVIPTADALYKSELYPKSEYVSGKQGKGSFDSLEYLIEIAKEKEIGVQAWVNPYRITMGSAAEPNLKLKKLAKGHPARKHPGWVVKSKAEGKMYFNPGIPAVIDMIADEMAYIASNYEVCGIHFDDYFYPNSKFDDDKTFKKYKGDFKKKGPWRRSNTDNLVKAVYSKVKEANPEVEFGISPCGVWANEDKNKLGSDTEALSSYYDLFADTRKWALENWIDYIIPQVYWHFGFKPASYPKVTKWWAKTLKNADTKLYIGHALYRLGSSKDWIGTSQIERQLDFNAKHDKIDGSVFYGYSMIKDNKYKIRKVFKNRFK